MLSLFRRIVCYVIALQMVLTPLYGASAQPVVMVSDTKAQRLLGTQVASLALINGQLIALNLAQQETNTKLDQVLAAIKYIPDPNSNGSFPTTDKVLIEFSSSLYAAYTSDSIAYNAMKEAAGAAAQAKQKVNPSAAPVATPATSGTPDPAGTPARKDGSTLEGLFKDNTSSIKNDPRASGFNPGYLNKGDKPVDSSTPPDPTLGYTLAEQGALGGLVPNPVGDFGAFNPSSAPPDPTLGYTLAKDSLIAKPSDPLGDIAKFTDMAVKLAGESARTFYNFQSLQRCGNALDCASSGLNTVTGVLKSAESFGLKLSPEFKKTMGLIGAGLSFANLVTNLFSGGFNVQKLLQFINGMQQNILFAAIAKGGLLTNDTNESKILRIMSNFTTLFGYAGLFALRDTNAVGWIVALNNFSQIGAATKDTPKTGPLSKDTPLAGTTNPPPNQTPNTEETAKFLRSMLRCNPQMANNSTSKCRQIEEANKRLFLGQLKSRCAAAAISKQQVPAKMFQELFTGTGNKERCEKVQFYDTKSGKELCPSIALLQASSLAEGSVMSQMNVLIGLSMYNLAMTNVNTEQVILQNACASLGDLIESGAPVYQAIND
jgi:hypothetical protein